jgi:hypothetical protein
MGKAVFARGPSGDRGVFQFGLKAVHQAFDKGHTLWFWFIGGYTGQDGIDFFTIGEDGFALLGDELFYGGEQGCVYDKTPYYPLLIRAALIASTILLIYALSLEDNASVLPELLLNLTV